MEHPRWTVDSIYRFTAQVHERELRSRHVIHTDTIAQLSDQVPAVRSTDIPAGARSQQGQKASDVTQLGNEN